MRIASYRNTMAAAKPVRDTGIDLSRPAPSRRKLSVYAGALPADEQKPEPEPAQASRSVAAPTKTGAPAIPLQVARERYRLVTEYHLLRDKAETIYDKLERVERALTAHVRKHGEF